LALEETQAVAFMKQEPPVEHDVSVFFRDDRSTSITGAFTAERLRGRGIATALLNQVLGRARCQHCERCAVSFEPRMYPFAMNVPAARFWMRHFQPVCYGLVRHVNKQVAWANERRDAADEW
jgi:GNAT superfamily N-acetyltransferase